MADAAGARLLVPVHHQSFRLSSEPFMEPIERIQEALAKARGVPTVTVDPHSLE